MSKLRKIMIWCVAVSAILIVFRVYNRLTDMPKITPPRWSESKEKLMIVRRNTNQLAGLKEVGLRHEAQGDLQGAFVNEANTENSAKLKTLQVLFFLPQS